MGDRCFHAHTARLQPTTVQVYKGSAIINTYKIIIYGDLTGDGAINVNDLFKIKRCLLKIENLNLENLLAADISRNGAVSIADLIAVKKHLLNILAISQS